MSRSIHQTNKSVFHGKSKTEVNEMCDPRSPDPDVLALWKKSEAKRLAIQERRVTDVEAQVQPSRQEQDMTLPTEDQRKELCDLMASAFVELRYFDGEQAHDLAYALHNLPKEIYGWGNWSVASTRARLQYYQTKHAENLGFNYVEAFNQIFGAAT